MYVFTLHGNVLDIRYNDKIADPSDQADGKASDIAI